jgi:hypothetical protein
MYSPSHKIAAVRRLIEKVKSVITDAETSISSPGGIPMVADVCASKTEIVSLTAIVARD